MTRAARKQAEQQQTSNNVAPVAVASTPTLTTVQTTVPETVAAPKPLVLALTAANLISWYRGDEVAIATPEEQTRVQTYLSMVKGAGIKTFREEFAKVVNQFPKGSNTRKVWLTRRSEAQAIFGAVNMLPTATEGKWTLPEGRGYKATVQAAKEGLEAHALKWDGSALLDDAGRKAVKAAEADVQALREGRKAFHDVMNRGAKEGESMEDWQERAEEAEVQAVSNFKADKETDAVLDMAAALYKKHGADFCDKLATALDAAIAKGAMPNVPNAETGR